MALAPSYNFGTRSIFKDLMSQKPCGGGILSGAKLN